MPGQQLLHPGKKGVPPRRILAGKIKRQLRRVQPLFKGRVIQKCLDLAGKQQRAVRTAAVVQRLYAEHVPRTKQCPGPAVPQRKGKHAAQPGQKLAAPLLPPVQQDLGVGAGRKAVAQRRQLGGQGFVVVDLAVENDDQIFILAVQRLGTARKVDDCQPAVAKGGRPLHKGALTVRAAVGDARQHGGKRPGIGCALPGDESRNSAHEIIVLSRQSNLPLPFCTLDLLAFYHRLW